MTTLMFMDDGWEVVTSAWSVAAKPGRSSITICYPWGADGISFFQSATGIASTCLPITMADFRHRVSEKDGAGIVDLRNA